MITRKGGRGPGRPLSFAAAVAISLLIALAAPLFSCASGDDGGTSTTVVPPTTSTTSPITTAQPSTTLAPTSTTVVPSTGLPGDSAGSWVEAVVPDSPTEAYAVSVSDEALLVVTRTDRGSTLWAHLFDRDELIQLPVSGTDVYETDIDGLLAVWWEATFVESSSSYTDQHIYAYLLPDGPKIDVTGDTRLANKPRVAGSWITWTEGTPSDDLPDEYWRMPIVGVRVDGHGKPLGAPTSLVPSAVAAVAGDAVFTYTLSGTHLAWEQGRAAGDLALGTHLMDLGTLKTSSVGREAWRPSIGGDALVYYEDGLKVKDLGSEQVREIDPRGDYPAAAPTFAAYFQTPESGGGYGIVARGFTGAYEQKLGVATTPPYLSPAIAASASHVAFVVDGAVKMFKWQGR